MHRLTRPALLAGAALLLALGVSQASALAYSPKDSATPESMDQLLTAVTQDVDAYWTKEFKESGLPEPRVTYDWGASGQAAAYNPDDDTIHISQEFATEIYDGALDQALPGSSQGYGHAVGDFAVAYIVAHEYGHQVQDELGLFEKYGGQGPTKAFGPQADRYAGTRAKKARDDNRP